MSSSANTASAAGSSQAQHPDEPMPESKSEYYYFTPSPEFLEAHQHYLYQQQEQKEKLQKQQQEQDKLQKQQQQQQQQQQQKYPKHYAAMSASAKSSPSAGHGGHGDELFTSEMRQRQARGKDPYHATDGTDDSDDDIRISPSGMWRAESFETTERKQYAAAVLNSPELLMMYAQSTGDSVPGARLHFMQILCGYEKDEAQSRMPAPWRAVGVPGQGQGQAAARLFRS